MAAMEDEQSIQMNTERNEGKEELKETGRIEAFSDGVFAVAAEAVLVDEDAVLLAALAGRVAAGAGVTVNVPGANLKA